ncbi:MAG: leucine-rich repeat protein [Muribaculaceae bacterium]|nr:leucine-rich repeat protein [Muribaculaceae bacterium]
MKSFTKLYRLMAIGIGASIVPNVWAASLTVNEGDDTNGYIPFHFYYLDDINCRSQVIYPASSLEGMKGQSINGITFYINEDGYASDWMTSDMILSIATVESEKFDGDLSYGYADFFEPEWTVCYSGEMSGEAEGRSLSFKFTTPFSYTGDNLLLQISLGEKGNAYPRTIFLGVNTDYMCSAYTTNGSTTYGSTFLPQTTFEFGELEPYSASVSTDNISFPSTLLGDTASSKIKVSNSGKNPFSIASTLDAPDCFTLGEFDTTLESGGSTEIPVVFSPATADEYKGVLTLDLGEAGTFTVNLAGSGIEKPTGYVADFDLPDKSLPADWIGWEVVKSYDYDVWDYVDIIEQKESVEKFISYEKDGKKGVTVEEGNHIREYPNMTIYYMISPEVEGNILVSASDCEWYNEPAFNIYKATKNEAGEWVIGTEALPIQWLSSTSEGWGIGLTSVDEPCYLAVDVENMAISSFCADKLAGAVEEVPVGTEFTVGDLEYKVVAENEVEVTGVASGVKEIEIPATVTHSGGAVLDVVSIGREAFYWSSVTKAVLPEGLRSIGYGAFRQSDLEEINLPSTLTEIGDYAFRTTHISSVEIPEGIVSLGSSVFAMCEQLTDVKLPSTLESLGSGVFYKAAITSVEIPESCLSIAIEAFESCTSLETVKLPSGLKEIKEMTFLGCSALKNIALPESLETIETQAFWNTGLETLNLPASVSKIASNTFTNSPIAEISVAEDSEYFKTVDGVLYDADGSFLYLYPRVEGDSYTVLDGTRGIIGGAFYKAAVKNVVLPETLAGIDEMAFCNSALEEISIPESVTVIFAQAFAGTQIAQITFPSELDVLEEGVLAGCEKLTKVELPESLESIANLAFYNCTALTQIICNGEKPAEFDAWEGMTDPFRGVDRSLVTVYCPDESLDDYKASEWADFFENIEGKSVLGSGIDKIEASELDSNTVIYDLSGRRIEVPAPGSIYIINGKKTLVK